MQYPEVLFISSKEPPQSISKYPTNFTLFLLIEPSYTTITFLFEGMSTRVLFFSIIYNSSSSFFDFRWLRASSWLAGTRIHLWYRTCWLSWNKKRCSHSTSVVRKQKWSLHYKAMSAVVVACQIKFIGEKGKRNLPRKCCW